MRYLRQSTAVDVGIGPFVDSIDGNTAETALSITQPDIRLKKNGGAWAQKSAAQTLSHEENGWYEVALSATDTDTLGVLLLECIKAGALHVWHEFMVLTANAYDSLMSTDLFQVDVTQWLGGTIPAVSTTGVPKVDVQNWLGSAAATPTVAGVPEVDVTHWIGTAASTPTTAGVPEVDVILWLGTAAQGAAGRPQVDVELWLGVAPNALISGRVDSSVGAMAADVITNTAIATDAIGSNELASTAVAEIQSGLATAAALGAVDANVQTILAAVDTEITAIKLITDQITFTGGRVNSNVGAIAGNTTAATNLDRGARASVLALAVASGSSTTVIVTNLTETTNDHYKDRTALFTTGTMAGQGRRITAYNGSTKALTVDALTETCADNDEIVIL
jgi:hypothetical protein